MRSNRFSDVRLLNLVEFRDLCSVILANVPGADLEFKGTTCGLLGAQFSCDFRSLENVAQVRVRGVLLRFPAEIGVNSYRALTSPLAVT